MSEFEQETNCSLWKKIHPTFKVHSVFHGGKQGSGPHKNKIYNQIRLVTIKGFVYLEVKTQKPEITFLCDINNYTKLRKHIWSAIKLKKSNTSYIETYKNKQFHKLIKPKYKIIDHINREGLDNRNCNLRETTYKQNILNRKLSKNNTTGYNRIYFCKRDKLWSFNWKENNKHKTKSFKTKQKAIEFKLAHDKITGNKNGYSV
jgi:hypothetical protein